ncbi:DUF2510 domain-containing protein [Streptomyces sp. S.PNR 29]|uniref:DUF2510 domain-containing protein n=1 Tax=Streptomyces sp. S.PNR 29 TaxID=2973805 RepID=UPI0025B2345E|nr:DUF2510 domain-containing protein [Streptomyces sp. S.PNR 29]MDN0196082.1 DUF2510 domain-containing protein [Streptomyces sp. S.PNR 29]
MTPPPGWYRDPSAPHLERWWDGTAWSEHRRAPGTTAQPPATGGGTGRVKVVALAAAGAVLAAAIATGTVVLGGDDGGTEAKTPPTAVGSTAVPPSAPPSASEPSADDPAVVEDQLNGITFPLLDGWVRPQYIADDDVMMTTDGTYDCPGDPGVCRRGQVISRTVTVNDETSPEVLAKEDISDAADAAYDRDRAGKRPFGGIESHRLVESGPVAVAGRAGYFVRWRVETAEGPGGYVQSLVFPSTVGTESPVLVRFVFDAGEDGPPLADMDRITKGIRPVGDAGTGGGVGSSIGP